MNRRDFLKAGATGVLGTAAREAQARTAPPVFDPAGMEAKLERMDRRMAWFAHHEIVPRPPKTPLEATLFDQRTRLARSAFRSFYFTGAFLDLTETEQMHPGVQERVARIQPDMEHAVNGMADLLSSMTPDQRRIIQKELRDKPQIGDDIVQMFHRTAVEDRFGVVPRLDMRLAFGDLTQRMKTQSPSLLIDPCIQKVRKIQANLARDAAGERDRISREGESRFWELEQRLAAHVREWDRVYAARPRMDLARVEAVYPSGSGAGAADANYYRTHPDSALLPVNRARATLKTGGYIMGFGAGSVATGALFYALAAATTAGGSAASSGFIYPAVVLGVTVGPILLAVGLIVVIVGGIWYLNVRNDERPNDAWPAASPSEAAPAAAPRNAGPPDSTPGPPAPPAPPDAAPSDIPSPDDAPTQL